MFNPWFTIWDGGAASTEVLICETGVYNLAGQDATISRTGNQFDTFETGVYTLSGTATFTGGVVTPEVTGGSGPPPPPFTFTITVRKKQYTFTDVDALVAFLSEQERKTEEEAKKKAKRDAKRILRIGPAKFKPAPPEFFLKATESEIKTYLEEVKKKASKQYWDELQAILGAEAEEIEDIKFLVGLDDD